MFEWLRGLFGGRPRRVANRPVRARYDAAQTTDNNRRHWANADGLSAAQANAPDIRRTLRNRARYETANNSYAKGLVSTLANDLIGTGPRLQLLGENQEANRGVETLFAAWARSVDLAGKLRTMRMALATDGEGVGVLSSNPGLWHPVQLDLRLVEAEQLATPDLYYPTATAADGVRYDGHGNPTEYTVLRHHPGDPLGFDGRYDTLPASNVLHWFRRDRAGQLRGVPDLLPALPLFAQLRRYTLAVIAAAEIAADVAGVLKTDAPAGGEADEADPFEAIEFERGMLMTLPGGWDMRQFDAKQPTTTYPMFKAEILKEISRCMNVPYNVAAGDSSGYNYASGRLDFQTYHRALSVDRSDLEVRVLERIFMAWLHEAALVKGLLPGGLTRRVDGKPVLGVPHLWHWDGFEHVDPLKEANAQAVRLASHTTTLAQEYARKGQDWEEQLTQRAKELKRMKELGLTTPEQNAAQQAQEDTADE